MNASAGCKPWSNTMEILQEKDGVDTELLVYAMTLINKVTELCCFPFVILSIILTELKLDQSHFSDYEFYFSLFLFFCRRLQRCQTRILSMTWWTVWKNRAWKQCPKDIWVGKAPISTWSSSSTSMRSAPLMIATVLLILEDTGCHVSFGQARLGDFSHQLVNCDYYRFHSGFNHFILFLWFPLPVLSFFLL